MEIEDVRAHSIREVIKAKTMERRLAEERRAWEEHKKTQREAFEQEMG